MKKLILVALVLLIAASGAFALEKAAGGGILYNAGFSNGSISSTDWTMSRNGFGVFGFFGFSQYAEFNLGFLYKNPSTLKVGGSSVSNVSDYLDAVPALQLGVYGKYPIPLSDTLVIFPTGGVDVEITLNSEDKSGFKWWHDLWIRGGAGLDFFLSQTMFLRSHLIYGLAIPVGGESDLGLKPGHGFLAKVGIGFML